MRTFVLGAVRSFPKPDFCPAARFLHLHRTALARARPPSLIAQRNASSPSPVSQPLLCSLTPTVALGWLGLAASILMTPTLTALPRTLIATCNQSRVLENGSFIFTLQIVVSSHPMSSSETSALKVLFKVSQ